MPRLQITDNARRYRRQMWLVLLVSLPFLWFAIQGLRERLAAPMGIASGLVFLALVFLAAALGLKVRRQTLADRAMHSRRAMIVMMTATLGKQDDASLERIQAKGGLPGEAAGLILKGRHGGARKP